MAGLLGRLMANLILIHLLCLVSRHEKEFAELPDRKPQSRVSCGMENSKHATKKSMIEISHALRKLESEAKEGKPVYAEMAARIKANEHKEADDMVREALEGGE